MSNIFNDNIMDEAHDVMEYFAGTMWERVLQRDINSHDWEALKYHIREAKGQMAMEADSEL